MLEDLGDLCISPGLVDLCVELNGESHAQVTRTAVMGGVTTIATHQLSEGPKYTDVAQLGVLSDDTVGAVSEMRENGVFGLRSFLVSQDSSTSRLTRLSEGVEEAGLLGLPVFLHPELTTDNSLMVTSPFREMDTAQRQAQPELQKVPEVAAFADESEDEEEEGITDEITLQMRAPKSMYIHSPDSKDQGVMRRTSLKVPTFVKPFDPASEGCDGGPKVVERKRVSLPSIFTGMSLGGKSKKFAALSKVELSKFRKTGVKENIKRGSWMSSSSESIEEEVEKAGDQGDGEEGNEYAQHLEAHPQQMEVDAVQAAIAAVQGCAEAKVHITAISSAEAVKVLSESDPEVRSRITVSTASTFLHFSDADIKPGDTRYKCNPPIRDADNKARLWEALTTKQIDCVTAYHQPHTPGAKFLGSFKKAKNGIVTLGLALQVLWTGLKPTLSASQLGSALCQLSYWLSTRPAQILGLSRFKGSLAPGKHADFFVWDPFAVKKVGLLPFQFPDMCPFKGEEVRGVVYRTYLRGNLVYSSESCAPAGELLNRREFS